MSALATAETAAPPPGSWAGWLRSGARPGAALVAFRWLVAGCQAATLVITWPLWQVHQTPPMLPAAPLPEVDLGVVLMASLAVILVRPTLGVALHTALTVYACLIDQTRLQPEIVSLIFLLWGSLPSKTAKAFARYHLVSMWAFAGVNKLLSPEFMHGTAQWILGGLVRTPPPLLREHAGYLIAGFELGVGLLALYPRTRRLAAFAAFALHATILLDLSPLGHNWNQAVWPWNVALAFSGFALIWGWRDGPILALGRAHLLARPAIVLVALAPIGFYFGVTDAYLAHNLYTSNTPRADWCRAGRGCASDPYTPATWRAFNVPIPPEHRLFESYFFRTCGTGDTLVIKDNRAWAKQRGWDQRTVPCPASA